MRIGFLGNTNNYPFQLAEIFRNKGCEVMFIVDADASYKLDRPEHMHLASVRYPYPDWIIEKPKARSWFSKLFPKIYAKDIIDLLNSCDAVILNGIGHSYKPFLAPAINSVSVFSGADLDVNARLDEIIKLSNKFPFTLMPMFARRTLLSVYVKHLRKGISQAEVISYFPKGFHREADELISEIMGTKPYKRFEHFHIRLDNIPYAPPQSKEKLLVFNLARFVWKSPLPDGFREWENKRNDLMLKGLSKFIKETGIEPDIHFVEKGIDVQSTKELAEELGLSKFITWHKEMSLQDVMDFYIKADIVFDHLGEHVLGGGLYAMAAGRPVITNTKIEIFEKLTTVPVEICRATNAHEVAEWLHKLAKDPAYRVAKGKAAREYVRKYFDLEIEASFFLEELQKLKSST